MNHTTSAADAATQSTPANIRVGSLPELLAIVPHLLGFLPSASLVVIGTAPPRDRIKVTLRYDLPDPPEADLAADISAHAASVIAAQGLTAGVAVGYGPDGLVSPLVAVLGDAFRQAGAELREFLRVQDDRFWSYLCDDERCCPAAGVPFDPAAHPVSAALAGDAPVLADRAAMAARIAPLPGKAEQSMRQATRRAERHVAQLLGKVRKSARIGAARHMIAAEGLAAVGRMVAAYRGGGATATDYEIAWLTVALKDLRVRDDAWARMDPGHREVHRRMWTDVVRRAQPGHVAAPASLLAFVAWQCGDGALANVALDRALADDPAYSMALLLRQVISAGAPPSLARLPMSPEEVAASYAGLDEAVDNSDDEVEEDYEDEGYEDYSHLPNPCQAGYEPDPGDES
jgi:Domain of unknown function (DUF4192)